MGDWKMIKPFARSIKEVVLKLSVNQFACPILLGKSFCIDRILLPPSEESIPSVEISKANLFLFGLNETLDEFLDASIGSRHAELHGKDFCLQLIHCYERSVFSSMPWSQ
tara:strand:+ start:162 stop:491 length:330 start_codon:yes stop_codon:yes gene_type:complete